MLGCHGDVVEDSVITSEKLLESAEKASYTYTLQCQKKLKLLKIQYNPNGFSRWVRQVCVCVCAFLFKLPICCTPSSSVRSLRTDYIKPDHVTVFE